MNRETKLALKGIIVREEVNLEIYIEGIIYAKNVVIDEETQMFLVVYLCRYKDGEVKLSDEHTDFKWVNKEELKTIISPEIRKDFEDNEVFELLS